MIFAKSRLAARMCYFFKTCTRNAPMYVPDRTRSGGLALVDRKLIMFCKHYFYTLAYASAEPRTGYGVNTRRLRRWHCLTVIKKKKNRFPTMFSGYAYPYRRCRKRKLIAYANPLSYTYIVCRSTTLAAWPLIRNRSGIVVILRHFRIEDKRMCR